MVINTNDPMDMSKAEIKLNRRTHYLPHFMEQVIQYFPKDRKITATETVRLSAMAEFLFLVHTGHLKQCAL